MSNKPNKLRTPAWRENAAGIRKAGMGARSRAVFRRRQEASRRRQGLPVHPGIDVKEEKPDGGR